MNLQSIRIFLAIVRQGSISGAARQLHFTQPTVSEYLNNLEKELGVQLFYRERGSRKVTLTQAGTNLCGVKVISFGGFGPFGGTLTDDLKTELIAWVDEMVASLQ